MAHPAEQPDSFVIQQRDLILLRGLFESRVMTARHISLLYFAGKTEATKKRLQKIKTAGLIGVRKRRVNEKSVLFLTRKGYALLHSEELLSAFPKLSAQSFEKRANVSDLTLRHELAVMDVKASFASALKYSHTYGIAEFSTWPRLHQFTAPTSARGEAEVLVKPDGFIRIHERENDGGLSEHTFFLEVDRSSETQNTLVARAASYLDYYKSGGFAVRSGAPRTAYKDFPFRVLIVLRNAERRNNTTEHLLHSNPPILTLTYLSTIAEVMASPLGAIWIRPIDYRNAVTNTAFEKQTREATYRRRRARETLVEDTITKLALLDS